MGNYCQRDPRWAAHPLGYGPALGTIGAYGCKLTSFADVATWAGYPITPPQLDEAFIAHGGIFRQDPTGTFDFLPDDALALLWPSRFALLSVTAGLASAVIAAALPTPDRYAVLGLAASGGRTHFSPVVALGVKIGDTWTGLTTLLTAYTGAGWSVTKTAVIRALPKPVPPPPTPTPPPAPTNLDGPIGFDLKDGTINWDAIEDRGHSIHDHPSG